MKTYFFFPAEVAANLSDGGVGKAKRGALDLAILGGLAGAYVALAGLVSLVVGHDAASFVGVGVSRLLIGSVFTLGLALVVLAGAELFTGNCLMVMSVLDRKITWRQMLRNWSIVYSANFAGALVVAGLAYAAHTGDLGGGLLAKYAAKVAAAKVALPFGQAFARGVLANWLVCLAVWAAAAAKDVAGKIAAMYLPIMGFVAANLEHSIANMFFVPYGLSQGLLLDWPHLQEFLFKNLLPVTIGNILGGAVLVGLAHWYLFLRKRERA